jgi:hypothetical protein
MKAGAGKQNAVVVILMHRYARLVAIAGLGLLSSSIATMIMTMPQTGSGATVPDFCELEQCSVALEKMA